MALFSRRCGASCLLLGVTSASAAAGGDAAPVSGSSLFNLPWNGPALKLGSHVVVTHPGRFGASAELGLSYYWQRRLEVGVGAQVLGLWAEDLFDGDYPERSYLDLALLPRFVLGYGRNDGIWRFQLFGGYGPTRMQATGGSPPLPRVERTVWSYCYGFGVSYGVLHLEAQWLGYMSQAEEGYSIILGQGEARESGSAGSSIALGVVFPIPLVDTDTAATP